MIIKNLKSELSVGSWIDLSSTERIMVRIASRGTGLVRYQCLGIYRQALITPIRAEHTGRRILQEFSGAILPDHFPLQNRRSSLKIYFLEALSK